MMKKPVTLKEETRKKQKISGHLLVVCLLAVFIGMGTAILVVIT